VTRVQHAVFDDLQQLAELFDGYRQFYRQPANYDLARSFMQERLLRGDSTILVATAEDATLVGFTQLYPTLCSVSAAPIFVLYDLFVSEQARRSGIGRSLLEAARQHAEQSGAVRMELATATGNAAAQRLYAALGWVRDDAFYRYSLLLR
jgi:ribosomal protein S18 acetylase RimI-like enzyme